MPFSALKEDEQQAFLKRLSNRGRKDTIAQDAQDLVVEGDTHVVLSPRTAELYQIELRRPADADELSKWIGVADGVRDSPVFQSTLVRDEAVLEDMLRRTKLLERKVPEGQTLMHVIAADREAQGAFRALAQSYVAGRLSRVRGLLPIYIIEEINNLTRAVDVQFGTWIDIVIRSGGTLMFDPPGPYSVVAHSLTVEPGGSIVTNNAHVSYDCTYMTIQ